ITVLSYILTNSNHNSYSINIRNMIEQYYTKLHLLFITFNILQLHTPFDRYDLLLITQ
ncbi:MAG: hypothetical protein K0S67_1742, partial [Nitrososphaeraceae archaeon]|nr:hypothetical protein [Nitrososphaeraceae archaeon]